MKYRTDNGKILIQQMKDGTIQKDTLVYHDESYREREKEMTIYGYMYDVQSRTMYGTEANVKDCGEWLASHDLSEDIPFIERCQMSKKELGRVIWSGRSDMVVYIEEKDGLRARQVMLEYLKDKKQRYEQFVNECQELICGLTGEKLHTGGADPEKPVDK